MASKLFKKVRIPPQLEVALLVIILVEVLILAYIMLGLRNDINENFSILLQKLEK